MIPATTIPSRHATLAAILVTARAIVADPARWCAWPHALDANGHGCEGREQRAARWGALGSLARAASDADASHGMFLEARQQLNDAAVRVTRNWTGTPWVMHYDAAHRMTVAIFDEAIRTMRRLPAPTAIDTLAIARILLARPERWAQGAIALDRHGKALSTFDGGCRFCAAGAIGLATHVLHERDPDRDLTGSSFEQAERLLDCAAYKLGEYHSYIGLNEHDGHAQVLAMFDHALDMASPQPAPEPEAS